MDVTEKDFRQLRLLSAEEVDKIPRIKSADNIIKDVKNYIDLSVQDAEISGTIAGAISMLIMIGKNDEEIITYGRQYFVKYIAPSIGVLQLILRDIQEIPSLPNNEEDMRALRLVKAICTSLINDFGRHEQR